MPSETEKRTPKDIRNALWEKAKAMQDKQADLTIKRFELAEAEVALCKALEQFGAEVYKVAGDVVADDE